MKKMTIAEKAEKRATCLRTASLIVAEKALFDIDFGKGLVTPENLLVEAEDVGMYFSSKLKSVNSDFRTNKAVIKSMVGLTMYLAAEDLKFGWAFQSIDLAEDSDVYFLLPAYNSEIIGKYDLNEKDLYYDVEEPGIELTNDAGSVAELLLNYLPICEAIESISGVLERGSSDSIGDLINEILSYLEPLPYKNFQKALVLFSYEGNPIGFDDLDNEVNELFKKGQPTKVA